MGFPGPFPRLKTKLRIRLLHGVADGEDQGHVHEGDHDVTIVLAVHGGLSKYWRYLWHGFMDLEY